MESPRIFVTGFPDDTTKTQLFIYFQSERDSGGGDVESIEIDRGRAVISFEDAKAAARVFNRTNHLFRDCQLQVSLLPKQACSNQRKTPPSSFKEGDSPGGPTTCMLERKNRREELTSGFDGQQTVPSKGRRELSETSQSFRNGSDAHRSQCTIEVTGLPHDVTEDLVVNYFENTKRSKGGPVSDVSINPELKTCTVTFECHDDAIRTVGHFPHNMSGACLQVSLFDEFEDESLDDSEENVGDLEKGITIIVSGISPSTTEDAVCNYFENSRRSGGGEVSKIGYNDEEETVITFLEVKDLQRLLEGKHSIKGKAITVRRQRPKPQSLNCSVTHRVHCTIEVTGLPQDATEDLVVNYFENTKRSKGGPVSDVSINPDLQTCKVTFESPDAARRTVEHSPHNLSGACLRVSLFDEFEDESSDDSEENVGDLEEGITIIVSGISTSTTEDAVCNYFENSRRSGGGEVSKIDYNDDEETVITFLEVKDLKRLLEGKHSIDGKPITVTRQRPLTRLPPDPVRIHIQGLSEKTTQDCLRFYLEKFSGNALVTKVFFGANNNALVVFDTPLDFQLLFEKVHKDTKGLDKSKPRLERVPICSSIMVTGLKDETSDDTVGLYFENEKRSGGKDVSQVERKGKDEALVSFQDPASVEKVIQKSHTLEGKQLKVTPHYPFLEDATIRKTEIPFDPDVFHYIQMNQEPELQMVLEECKVQVELPKDSQAKSIVVCPTDNKKNNVQAWRDRVGRLESFLQSFKKIQLDIASEIFDEIVQRWEKQSSIQGPYNFLVSFDDHRRLVQIIGKVVYVDKEKQKLQELISEVTEDTELMKSVVKVVEDNIPKSRLTLLEMSGICERLRNKHRHLSIAIDSNGQKLCLEGPRSDLQEVRIEVFTFISRIVEQTTELPAKVISVLKRPQVSRFIQDVLKQNSIQAVLFYDQRQSSNEVQVVGVDSSNARGAENVLQATIKEQSHHLSAENSQVLESPRWKDFQSSIASQFKVGITVDNRASTIWVSGIGEDVEKCFKEVKTFLEMNTILRTTIPIEHGTTRFLTEVWKEKIEGIKTELANCSIDMRVTANTEGIEISGTADGLEKCLPQLQALIYAVQRCSVPIDKPGMKKFFAEEKGQHLLKATGGKHRCIILRGERKKGDVLEGDTVAEEKEVGSASEHICSYLTKEEKRISVLKGDITKDRVDAIVNAANGDLKHIGGLAAAIVRAGGNEIQQQCTAFVREHGPLLEGQAMVSTAGSLPCNKVIHAVGPKWDHKAEQQHKEGQMTKQERYLKFAITNSLKEAIQFRSIAIPAVSSGVFGLPRDICAKVIVDAILDFCEENPRCNLSDIHLINIDDPTVTAFAKEMKKRFAEDRNFKQQSNYRRPAAAYGFTRDSNASAEKSFTTQGLCITVKAGDLAKEQADILVGTAASNLNLSQNPCAKALSQVAGPSLQQECTNIGRVAVGDIAVNNQPGNLNCKAVIFAICSEWESGKGKKVLKRLLTKCLQAASTQGMTSIAFPAIGTGTLQFPRAEVAEIFFDEVMSFNQKNPMTSLKEVTFVLYAPDYPTVQAFEAELKKRIASNAPLPVRKRPKDSQASSSQTTAFSPVRERDQDHLDTTVGTLCFKVQSGDITKETTDAIVIISNKDLDIKRGGGAGAAILKSGGYSIQQECSQKGPQHPGSVVITRAGNLNTRFILHIVPSKHQNVKASVLKCLQEAEKKGLSSISFPAIGTGNLGMSAIDCTRTMLTAIREFNDQQPTSMQLIKMVIFQKEMMKDVRSAIEEASGEIPSEKPGIIQRVVSRVGGFLGFGDSEKRASSQAASLDAHDRSFNLAIFAGCNEDLEAAVTEIKEVMKEKSTKQVIENDAITALTEIHRQKIHTLELRYDVEATVEKEVGRVVVSGHTDDILNVVGEIYKILDQVKEDEHERKRAEVLSKDIQWRYKDADKFVDYDSHTNAKIETAHHENKPDVSIMGGSYKIVFSSMTLKDRFGSTVAEVERVDRRGGVIPVPRHWNPQPKDQSGFEKAVHLYELDPSVDAQEYQSVQNQFQQTCGNGIIKIERIQNPALYVTYAIRKKKMDEAKGSNEMILFHGTPGDNCQLINKTGFNRSFHGKNATVYGNGVYFASNASYSARSTYSPTDMNGYRYMYLTRVLVGDYAVGRPGLLTPPPKNVDPTDTYDSVVNQIPNPTIFVVFYDWQCYPEYLITFQ